MGKRHSVIRFIKNLVKRVFEDRVFDLAAQLAYFFLLSLFPFLIFTFGVLPYIGIDQTDVLAFISHYAPPELMDIIRDNLKGVFDQHAGLLSFSVIATIWPTSTAIMAIIRVLNQAYGVRESRSFIVARGMAILLTFALIFVILIALLLNVFGPSIGRLLVVQYGTPPDIIKVFDFLRLALSFIIIILVFACLYLFAPNKRLKISEVLLGAIFAAVGWQLASYAFSYYVDQTVHFSATYGTLGGIIVLLIWFYLTGFILILGGEINALLYQYRKTNRYSRISRR
ncbi:YihY/virulence factor BrkB family protein [Caenibacillus caldisaponilyticus]|uniref:YihY/virulence factor BrkB family protein n=1 Tax=Caenibacillus caldisaponilyticus TaxID=1674942 RepID=UPI000988577E|nr:YihY/virulence factor BrkB family protein [Caenibacillus caldisaponilyticus]